MDAYLIFDGQSSYVEVSDSPELSVATTGSLTISAWIRPDTLHFPMNEKGYVHWLGKGEDSHQEWTFRMYNDDTDRPNRISFYVFNSSGHIGVGSYFQDSVDIGEWIHVVGVAHGNATHIYRDGVLQDTDSYAGQIVPKHGPAPMRIATRDFHSWFQGGIAEVRVWKRALSDAEIAGLYRGNVPRTGLVAEYLFLAARDSAGTHHGVVTGAVCGTDS